MDLLEAIPTKVLNKREVEIVILEEGPGNKQRKCWYGKEAIESGGPVFRGAQVFSNHPSKTQMTDLPERDVKEVIGRIKETWVAKAANGRAQLRGILKVLEGDQYDWVLSLMHESIQAQKEGYPPVAQVSIHADGDVEKRMMEGDQYNYVKNIKSAVSVDVVTKGGIKSAGFTKFVESLNEGKTKMTNEERLGLIQKKLSEALTSEDQSFLDRMEQEDPTNLQESEGEDEYEQVFATENGFVTADGTPVSDEEVIGVDENENVYGLEELAKIGDDAEAGAFEQEDTEESAEDNTQEDYTDAMEQEASGQEDTDEVPVSELATRYPYLANEIDREEAHHQESARDRDIVNLKFENKLLKTRMIAEKKIMESELPAGFVTIDDLMGRTPADMDRLIESKRLFAQNVFALAESAAPANPPAQVVRESDYQPGVGRRILENAVLPTY